MISEYSLKLYTKALHKWGAQAQSEMATEELAELIVAIRHYGRNKITKKQLITEFADVYIMMEQVQLITGIGPFEIELEKESKLKRLEKRLEN